MLKISPFAARRPLKGAPYQDAVPSSIKIPGTNGAVRVGGCETPGPDAVDGGALGGVDSGGVVGVGAGTVLTGRRPAQPANNSAKMNPAATQREKKNGNRLMELRSRT
ncbi:MAG TPA: hypothetical protein VHS08_08185 [Candidatus Acidoferrales bacterium]|nr:hypothetical protein [Candidatus Acidoferrales bacterium]